MLTIADFIDMMPSNESRKVEFIQKNYNKIENLCGAHVVKLLATFSNESRKVEVVQFFQVYLHQHVVDTLNLFSNESRKVEVVQALCARNSSLNKDTNLRIIRSFSNESRKVEVVQFLQLHLHEYVLEVVNSFSNESRKVEAVQALCGKNSYLNSGIVFKIIGSFSNESRKDEMVRYFVNWFSKTDIVPLLKLFKSDSRKLDVIKLFDSKSIKLTLDDVYAFIDVMTDDDGRVDVIKFYIKSWNLSNIPTLLTHIPTESGKLNVLKLFPQELSKGEPYTLLTFFADAKYRQKLINFIQMEVKPTKASEFLTKAESDKFKLEVLLSVTGIYETPDGLVRLLTLFQEDNNRLEALRVKLESVTNAMDTIVQCIGCFQEDKYKYLAFEEFNQKMDISEDVFLDIVSIIPGSLKVNTAVTYSDKKPIDFERLLLRLDSPRYAYNFLMHKKYTGLTELMTKLGYKMEGLTEEPLKEIQREEMVYEEALEEIPEIMEFTLDDLDLDRMMLSFARDNYKRIRYDVERKKILGNNLCGMMNINGKDLHTEVEDQARKAAKRQINKINIRNDLIKKRQEERRKLSQVKHAYMCVVCNDKATDTVIQECGHSCMCNHCAKIFLKIKPECPMCKTTMKNVVLKP